MFLTTNCQRSQFNNWIIQLLYKSSKVFRNKRQKEASKYVKDNFSDVIKKLSFE